MDQFKINCTELNDDYHMSMKGIATGVMDEKGNTLKKLNRNPERQPGRQFIHVLKKVLIQVGLLLLLCGYLAGGGYLFRTLELENEYSECKQKYNSYVTRLNFSVSRVIGLVKSETTGTEVYVREMLEDFAGDMFQLDFQPGTDCERIMSSEETTAQWSVPNAIFFCATVITTIGYGNIAPATFWGRIICIFYATIGIPLMLIYLAILGSLMAKAFRLIYVNIICCRCFYDVARRKRQKRRERLQLWEQALRQHEEEEARRRGLPVPPQKVQPLIVEEEDNLDAEDRTEGEIIAVPLTVSIVVLTSFTAIGALIFQIWEGWSFADAAYFSFVTISTIGFGDLVPGAGNLHESERWAELGVGALYLLFGLATLSMCLNLLQDEMVAKVRYLLQCCGGGKESDETEPEETTQTIGEDFAGEKSEYVYVTSKTSLRDKDEGLENKAYDHD